MKNLTLTVIDILDLTLILMAATGTVRDSETDSRHWLYRKEIVDMKKLSAVVLAALIMAPAPSFAWGGRRPYHGGRTVIVRHHDSYNGAAIAAGVLGGIATGIILDRVLLPPPVAVVGRDYPPPPAPRDPYDAGYSDGYGRGVERGRYERYEQGRSRGYNDGYEDARSGRY
jgi:hypothetical protein